MIAGIGFATMAWREARRRVHGADSTVAYYASREYVDSTLSGSYPVHREYYRIIDEAWAAAITACRYAYL